MTIPDLPHDLDAERAVLGSVLIRESISDVMGVVTTDDFMVPAHREIWESMMTLDAARKPIDVVMVIEDLRRREVLGKLDGREGYLLICAGAVPTAEHGHHYATIVREKAVARRIIAACADAMVKATNTPTDDVLGDLRVALADLGGSNGGPVVMAEAVPPYLDALEGRKINPVALKIPSGIRALDNLIGGHRAGQQIVVAGNTGSGKTSHAVSTAIRAAATGVPVLIFSLEMMRDELLDRALAFTAEIDGSRIANGDLDYDHWKRVGVKAKDIAALPISIDDRKLTIDQIVAEALRWRARQPGPLALVVVDYLGLIRSVGRHDNRQLEMGAMSRALKILAGDLKCPVIVVAQLNRQNQAGGEPRRPVLSDLRDSGEIEQNADVVIFTWRSGTLAELIVAKQRGGPCAIASVRWDGRYTAFYDDMGPESAHDDGRFAA